MEIDFHCREINPFFSLFALPFVLVLFQLPSHSNRFVFPKDRDVIASVRCVGL